MKTHWKKNNDSRYISGEDLKDGIEINKGLKPEMVVKIVGFSDKETYDQTDKEKTIKTGLMLFDLERNVPIEKPLILNNTNAKFLIKEFGSPFMEDWTGKPIILWAQPDKRFDFVARLKKFYAPQISDANGLAVLNESKTLDELKTNWSKLSKAEQALPTIINLKETLKNRLTNES